MNKPPNEIYLEIDAHGEMCEQWNEGSEHTVGITKPVKYIRADLVKSKIEKLLAHCGIDDPGDACRAVIKAGKEILKELGEMV